MGRVSPNQHCGLTIFEHETAALFPPLVVSLAAAPPENIPKTGSFIAGLQAWTFNKGTLFEAIDQTKGQWQRSSKSTSWDKSART